MWIMYEGIWDYCKTFVAPVVFQAVLQQPQTSRTPFWSTTRTGQHTGGHRRAICSSGHEEQRTTTRRLARRCHTQWGRWVRWEDYGRHSGLHGSTTSSYQLQSGMSASTTTSVGQCPGFPRVEVPYQPFQWADRLLLWPGNVAYFAYIGGADHGVRFHELSTWELLHGWRPTRCCWRWSL